ncbi:MAG TPA: hypothetical protein DCY06_10975 [Bacteroidetes bacterium]|nr:hypothetical protein [Bacteroidota bacterium]
MTDRLTNSLIYNKFSMYISKPALIMNSIINEYRQLYKNTALYKFPANIHRPDIKDLYKNF